MIRRDELLKYNETIQSPGIFNNNHLFFVDENNECELKIQLHSYTKELNAMSYSIFNKTDDVNENLKILKLQIDMLNPNLVIIFSNTVAKMLNIITPNEFTKIGNTFFILIDKHNITFNVKKVNDFLKTHALIKVTNKKVYYRDINFVKCEYANAFDNSYCFIPSEIETQYTSYKGEYLQKINKQLQVQEKTYEKHLTKKDIFYYENIYDIQHSKIVRYMLFDIETDGENNIITTPKSVTSIAFYDSLTQQYYALVLNTNNQTVTTEYLNTKIKVFENEVEMLTFFLKILKQFDVLSGWYSNDFDVPYIVHRAKTLGIQIEKYFENLFIKIEHNEVKIYQDALILYDSLQFYKMNVYYNKPPSYSLDAVSKFLFGQSVGKINEGSKTHELWTTDINELVKYNIHDVYLLKKIVDIQNIINYPLNLQQFCPQDFENVFYNSKTIENLLHHRYWNKKIYFPTKIQHAKRDFQGALVNDPVAGLHSNVAVFDFAAMYTNIYLTFNFSDDTLIGEKQYVCNNFDTIKNDICKRYPHLSDKFEMYSKDDCIKQFILSTTDFGEYYYLPKSWKIGILPALEQEILALRKMYTKKRNEYNEKDINYKIYDELQGTAKTILNSIYGIGGYEKFILYNDVVASSITTTARELNLWVQQFAKDHNFVPLYGDTDSIFIAIPNVTCFNEFISLSKEFEDKLNTSFITFVTQKTNDDYTINTQTTKIEFEKAFEKLRLTTVKKRYFGALKFYKGKILEKQKISVTGFETRRDDTPHYFKTILLKSYELLLQENYKQELLKYYKILKTEIYNQTLENLLIRIKLSKNIDTYTNLPIHVRALQNSKTEIKRGDVVNMIYVKGPTEVMHVDETKDIQYNIDYEKYVQKFFVDKINLIDKDIFETQQSLKTWFGE